MITDNRGHMEEDHTIIDPLDHYLPFDLDTLRSLKTDQADARGTYALAFYRQIGQKRELLRCAYCGFSFEDYETSPRRVYTSRQ